MCFQRSTRSLRPVRAAAICVAIIGVGAMASFADAVEPPAAIDINNPSEGIFADEWFVVRMNAGKVGHAHATMHRDGQRITSNMAMELEFARGTAVVSVAFEQTTREFLDGTPVGFDSTIKMGAMPLEIKGKIRDGKVHVRQMQGGVIQSDESYPFDPEIRLSWGMFIEQAKRGLEPGTDYTVKTYDASLRPDAPLPARVEVIGPDVVDVLGEKISAIKVRQTLIMADGTQPAGGLGVTLPGAELVTDSWVLPDGTALRMDTKLGGIVDIQMIKSTRAQALGKNEPAEMLVSLFVDAKGSAPGNAREVVYTLRATGDGGLPDLPNSALQTFERIDAQSGRLTVRRGDWLRDEPASRDAAPADRVYLRASAYADCNNERIKALAKRAVGDVRTPREKADRIQAFVAEYIVGKGFDVGFATATEVAANRSGDCTEHSVLTAALARAAGIPARGVGGIMRVPTRNSKTQFGWHMWTQVWIDGQWIDLDAAFGQSECDPFHIALSVMDLGDTGIGESSIRMLPLIGGLEISIESATAGESGGG
jgi:hypothetical protein